MSQYSLLLILLNTNHYRGHNCVYFNINLHILYVHYDRSSVNVWQWHFFAKLRPVRNLFAGMWVILCFIWVGSDLTRLVQRVLNRQTHFQVNTRIALLQNRKITLSDECLRSFVWRGAGVLGPGLEPGGAVLLVHIQHTQGHAGKPNPHDQVFITSLTIIEPPFIVSYGSRVSDLLVLYVHYEWALLKMLLLSCRVGRLRISRLGWRTFVKLTLGSKTLKSKTFSAYKYLNPSTECSTAPRKTFGTRSQFNVIEFRINYFECVCVCVCYCVSEPLHVLSRSFERFWSQCVFNFFVMSFLNDSRSALLAN